MRMLRLFLSKNLRHLARDQRDMRELIDRLEITARRQQLKIDELATDLERLSDRLCATQGRLLGGGRGRPKRAPDPHADVLTREQLALLPKDELREYLKRHPPKAVETAKEA